MFRRPDLRNINPWVIVDRETFTILEEGTFSEMVKSKKGNMMTKTLYQQFLEERSL